MKFLFVLLLACACCAFAPADAIKKGVMIIEFDHLKAETGEVEVSLYNEATTFLNDGAAFYTKRQKVVDGKIKVVFDNIPYGDYAAVSYHDVNDNHKFDRNFLGIPKEPVAVSQLTKKQFSKPCFREAKVGFHQSQMIVKMRFVKY